jgi:inosose dehydratase
MSLSYSRRGFLGSLTAVAATAFGGRRLFAEREPQLKVGYTSITWGTAERQAIDDISSLGYAGIQMRNNAVSEFKPDELRTLLQQRNLEFVALSSGELNIDPAVESQQLDMHVSNARFVKAVGGLYLQVLDQLKPYPRKVSPDECVRLGKLLSELGKRVSDEGVKLGYHNHMNTISEHPENLQRVMDASDPRYVGLELDTAHSVAGGGDPAKAILHYRDRLLFLHLKDVVDIPLDTPGAKYPFKFVELGRGRVNLPAVMDALRKTKFNGWMVVELDKVPDKSRTPRQCAAISKEYLQNQLHVAV